MTQRVETLLSAMTPEEKIGQLVMESAGVITTGPTGASPLQDRLRAGQTGSILNIWGAERVAALQRLAVEESRLGVPVFFGLDVLHGQRTVFPVPLAEAGTFDPKLWQQTARMAAREASAEAIDLTFAPMVDVSRDPRWGRVVEGAGEDPFLTSAFARAKIAGFQAREPSLADSIAATAKHFVAYGAPVAGRDYASADVSERSLHEVHLPPFAAAVETDVLAVMTGFHDLAGIPMSAHTALVRGWLRDKAGFSGVVISDYNAIAELIPHGVAGGLVDAAALALNAGIDIDMASGAYSTGLLPALEQGLVELETLDAAVRRVLLLKERLGLFDDPFRRCHSEPPDRAPARVLARRAAAQSMVVLQDRKSLLPLESSSLRRLAVLGPLADASAHMLGPWACDGRPEETVSPLEGLRAALAGVDVVHAAATAPQDGDEAGFGAARQALAQADAVVLCLGETREMSGEAASRAALGLTGRQRALAEMVLTAGKPVVTVLFTGRPLVLPWLFDRADCVLCAWWPGSEAGNALADVLLGRQEASGRLAMSWPRHEGQIPIFHGQRPTGRPTDGSERYASRYIDQPVTPQFPFGYGLPQAHLALGPLVCDDPVLRRGNALRVNVTVSNSSERSATETLLAFMRPAVSKVARPVTTLIGFRRMTVPAGQTFLVDWRFVARDFSLAGIDYELRTEPGFIDLGIWHHAAGLRGSAAAPLLRIRIEP